MEAVIQMRRSIASEADTHKKSDVDVENQTVTTLPCAVNNKSNANADEVANGLVYTKRNINTNIDNFSVSLNSAGEGLSDAKTQAQSAERELADFMDDGDGDSDTDIDMLYISGNYVTER